MRWLAFLAAAPFLMCCASKEVVPYDRSDDQAPPLVEQDPTIAAGSIADVLLEARERLLGSNREELSLGKTCYFGMQPPPGWWAVHYLTAAERWDVLLFVFKHAPTSEGRLWAAYGLSQAGKLERDDLERLARAMSGDVHTCSGCLFFEDTAEAALRNLL